MGRSIVACLLAAGHRVVGVTNELAGSDETLQRVRVLLDEMRAEDLLAVTTEALMARFRISDAMKDAASSAIVVESATEDLDLKRSIFREVEKVVAPTTLIASNTSAIPVSQLQAGAAHPERFIGLHWDEPAHVTRFLEVIPGPATSLESVQQVVRLAPAWGKEPSVLKREIRGFITNRVSYAMFREACHLVDSGVCTVEDVDRSLRNDVGWWIPFAGPFRYMDLMGVEAYYRVMRDLLPDLSTSPDIPPLMRSVVESGGRGVSNGRGFYNYSAEEAKRWQEKFDEFNFKIRRLTGEYRDLHSPPEKKDQ